MSFANVIWMLLGFLLCVGLIFLAVVCFNVGQKDGIKRTKEAYGIQDPPKKEG